LSDDVLGTLRLETLGTREIAALLENAGGVAAQLALNASFIDSLYSVSGGDPFYLHFLVEEVQRGDVTEKIVDKTPTGLTEYLAEWWNQLNNDVDVSRQEVNDLLGVLTVALGPLRLAELAGVTPTLHKGVLLNRELSGKLRRYLIGNAHDGYALCHPRFADYLKTIFLAEEQQAFRDQLLSYCERWREHKSIYALSYYPAHLNELDRDADLLALINKDWMEAQFQRVLSHSAFCADVELALGAAIKTITPASFVQIVRNSIVYATVGSLATKVPLAALEALAEVGQQEKAMAYASLIPDKGQQIEAFCRVGRALVHRGQTIQARAVLERAVSAADAIEAWQFGIAELGYSEAPILAGLANTLVEVGDTDLGVGSAKRAVALALSVSGTRRRDGVLASVAGALAQPGLVDQAIVATEAIGDMQARALVPVLRALVQSGQTDRAENLCETQRSQWERIPLLVKLVEIFTEAGDHERATGVADRVVSLAEAQPAHWFRASLLAQAARAANRAGKQARAVQLANEAVAEARRKDATSEVKEAQNGSPDEWKQMWVAAAVARGLAQAGQIELASQVATTIRHVETGPVARRAEGRALWEIARFLARAGESERALELAAESQDLLLSKDEKGGLVFECAMPELDDTYDISGNPTPIIEVIAIIAEVGQVDRALAAAAALPIPSDKASAQVRIVEVLIRVGQLDRALKVAGVISDTIGKAHTSALVAAAMALKGSDCVAEQVANQAITEAQIIDEPWSATQALVDVVEALADATQIERAFMAAEALRDAEARAWAFVEFGKTLAKGGKHQSACEAMERALKAADHAEASWSENRLARQNVVYYPGRGEVCLGAALPRNVLGPSALRGTEKRTLVGPSLSMLEQANAKANTKALILQEVVGVLARIDKIERAAQIIHDSIGQAPAAGSAGKFGDRDLMLAQAVGAYARLNKAEGAQIAAEAITDPCRAAHAFAIVALAFSRLDQKEKEAAAAGRAIAALRSLRGSPFYDENLIKILITLAQAGRTEEFFVEVEDFDAFVGTLLENKGALGAVVQTLLQSGDSDRATEIVNRAIVNSEGNARYLTELLPVLVRVGRKADLAEFGSKIRSASESPNGPLLSKAQGLVQLANAFARVGEREQANTAARLAVEAAESIEDPRDKGWAQIDAARTLAEVGQVDQALEFAERIAASTFKTTALLLVVRALVNEGQNERAVKIAYSIANIADAVENPLDRAQSFVRASTALAEVGEGADSAMALVNAVLCARFAGRSCLFQTLKESVPLLCSIDGCHTMWQIHEALLEVDRWWSIAPGPAEPKLG